MKNIETDVLVIGAGSAGISAAIAAAKEGLNVSLLERNSFAGGKASAAIVGTICGLYTRFKHSESNFVCTGFVTDFANRLMQLCEMKSQSNAEGLHYLPYHPFKFKLLADQLLMEAKVNVFYHAPVFNCTLNATEVCTISSLIFDQPTNFYPKVVVDCSGEAIVSLLAGLVVDESEDYQAAAQVFELHKVNSMNESALSIMMMKEISKAIQSGTLNGELHRVSIVPGSFCNGSLFLKIALPYKIDHSFNSFSMLEMQSRKLVNDLINFLSTKLDALKDAQLGEVASEAGVRTGRRPIGKYTLTEQDVLACKKFEYGIANGAWPIEFWEPGKSVRMQYFSENDYYQIPADCLVSKQLDNLFFAGRSISADNSAIASARVIGTCMQTGYAAGKLAAAKVLGISQSNAIKNIRREQLIIEPLS